MNRFTLLDCLAFDLLRKSSTAIQPCWLVLSDEAKTEARINVVKLLNTQMKGVLIVPLDASDLQHTEKVLQTVCRGKPSIELMRLEWERGELLREEGRKQNDPHAFFAR